MLDICYLCLLYLESIHICYWINILRYLLLNMYFWISNWFCFIFQVNWQGDSVLICDFTTMSLKFWNNVFHIPFYAPTIQLTKDSLIFKKHVQLSLRETFVAPYYLALLPCSTIFIQYSKFHLWNSSVTTISFMSLSFSLACLQFSKLASIVLLLLLQSSLLLRS